MQRSSANSNRSAQRRARAEAIEEFRRRRGRPGWEVAAAQAGLRRATAMVSRDRERGIPLALSGSMHEMRFARADLRRARRASLVRNVMGVDRGLTMVVRRAESSGRPAGRRRRHVARATSSADPGDDPEPERPPSLPPERVSIREGSELAVGILRLWWGAP